MATHSAFNSDDYTLQEIANKLGVTRERARQIEMSALKKLKHPKHRKQFSEIFETLGAMNNPKDKGLS